MSNQPTPEVACTVTDEELAERPDDVLATLRGSYRSSTERVDGYTHVFDGTDASLVAVATFVSNELECCGFADFTIDVSPPYDDTRLSMTGPDGTKELLSEQFIVALEAP